MFAQYKSTGQNSLETGPLWPSGLNHLILSISVNVTFTCHRLSSTWKYQDHSNPRPPSAHFSLRMGQNMGVETLSWFLLVQLRSWRCHRPCPPALGAAHTASHSCVGQGRKKKCHAETSDSHLRLHYITLCICTSLKISIIKSFFFFKGSIRTLRKKIQKRNS